MNLFAIFELCFGSALWGFSFVATTWCLESFSPAYIVGLRFLISFLVSLLLFHIVPRRKVDFETIKIAFIPSLLLSILMLFTAWGQKYTTATNSGFITCLYVLYVPLFEKFISKRTIPKIFWLFISIGLIGSALICNLQSFQVNFGDLLILIGSVFAGAQIFWFGLVAKKIKSGFIFNTWQSFLSMLIPLFYAFSFEKLPTKVTSKAWIGLIIMSIGSTLIGFALQVRGQKRISATTASIVYQIESPIAAIFAYFLLGERLSSSQLLGASLIFGAALGASLFSSLQFKNTDVRIN